MSQLILLKENARLKICGKFCAAILVSMLSLSAQPIWCASSPSSTAEYEISLSELKRIMQKKAVKKAVKKAPEQIIKAKNPAPKKTVKQGSPLVESASWATLESVRMIDKGVRLDIKNLDNKFTLVLEPHNKKVILQFVGLRYRSGEVRVPLGTHGFVQARIGRHIDGTWIVMDTSDAVLPEFEVHQDRDGITLKTFGSEPSTEFEDFSDRSVLLTKEAVNSARFHVLTPDSSDYQTDSDESDLLEQELSPLTAESAIPPQPSDEPKLISINHIPFSFVVAEKQTIIQAVVSSKNDVKEVYCVVQTAEEGKPALVPMKKASETLYTYEGRLPEQPAGNQALRYRIVARDIQDNVTQSDEFIIPVTQSSVVPGWQQ